MTPIRLLKFAIVPALSELAARGIPDSFDARRVLLAIALQESGLRHRRQVVAGGAENGPAASFWQFEKGGACRGVLEHRAVAPHAAELCEAFNVQATPAGLWEAMRYQDIVAAAMARLLIYTLPQKLPTSTAAGWQQYLAAWRPGKPHEHTWPENWSAATHAVQDFEEEREHA